MRRHHYTAPSNLHLLGLAGPESQMRILPMHCPCHIKLKSGATQERAAPSVLACEKTIKRKRALMPKRASRVPNSALRISKERNFGVWRGQGQVVGSEIATKH